MKWKGLVTVTLYGREEGLRVVDTMPLHQVEEVVPIVPTTGSRTKARPEWNLFHYRRKR